MGGLFLRFHHYLVSRLMIHANMIEKSSVGPCFSEETRRYRKVHLPQPAINCAKQSIQRVLRRLLRLYQLLPHPQQLTTHVLIVVAGLVLRQLALKPIHLSGGLNPA
jgi:hypothetical protein